MISDNISKALNEQITNELNSAYSYLAMSAHYSARNLNGFAHWFRVQYEEECTHALRIFDHILDRGGTVSLSVVSEPQCSWDSPTAAFTAALAEERRIARSINELMELAISEKDHATRILLDWFVTEHSPIRFITAGGGKPAPCSASRSRERGPAPKRSGAVGHAEPQLISSAS